MTEGLTALATLGQSGLTLGFVVFLRVGAAVALLPAFGERSIPQRVRLAVAIAFTMVVAPVVSLPEVGAGWLHLLPLIATETLVGLVFGLSLRLMVFVLQMAASMAAQSMSLAQLVGGASGEPMPAYGHVLTVAGLALAVSAGLHIRVAEALISSYRSFPVGSLLGSADLAEFWTARISMAFGSAFSFAAPFVVAAFLYNLALGAINRAMPQLMVVLVGAPAITFAGLVMMALVSPVMLQIWLDALSDVLASPFGTGR